MIDDERRKELDAELDRLNGAVKDAVEERKAWMDAHMADYAKFQIGEMLYDLNNGRRLGRVTEHYRYHRGNFEFDTSMHIEYQYRDASHPQYNFINNTSSQIGLSIGNKETLEAYTKARLSALRYERSDGSTDWAAVFAEKQP